MPRRVTMADGSICFADVPVERHPRGLVESLRRDADIVLVSTVGSVVETWVDFRFRGHPFSAHDPMGDWWLFARPDTPPLALRELTDRLGGEFADTAAVRGP